MSKHHVGKFLSPARHLSWSDNHSYSKGTVFFRTEDITTDEMQLLADSFHGWFPKDDPEGRYVRLEPTASEDAVRFIECEVSANCLAKLIKCGPQTKVEEDTWALYHSARERSQAIKAIRAQNLCRAYIVCERRSKSETIFSTTRLTPDELDALEAILMHDFRNVGVRHVAIIREGAPGHTLAQIAKCRKQWDVMEFAITEDEEHAPDPQYKKFLSKEERDLVDTVIESIDAIIGLRSEHNYSAWVETQRSGIGKQDDEEENRNDAESSEDAIDVFGKTKSEREQAYFLVDVGELRSVPIGCALGDLSQSGVYLIEHLLRNDLYTCGGTYRGTLYMDDHRCPAVEKQRCHQERDLILAMARLDPSSALAACIRTFRAAYNLAKFMDGHPSWHVLNNDNGRHTYFLEGKGTGEKMFVEEWAAEVETCSISPSELVRNLEILTGAIHARQTPAADAESEAFEPREGHGPIPVNCIDSDVGANCQTRLPVVDESELADSEQQVLKAIRDIGRRCSGSEIRDQLSKNMGDAAISESTVKIALKSLKRGGFIDIPSGRGYGLPGW